MNKIEDTNTEPKPLKLVEFIEDTLGGIAALLGQFARSIIYTLGLPPRLVRNLATEGGRARLARPNSFLALTAFAAVWSLKALWLWGKYSVDMALGGATDVTFGLAQRWLGDLSPVTLLLQTFPVLCCAWMLTSLTVWMSRASLDEEREVIGRVVSYVCGVQYLLLAFFSAVVVLVGLSGREDDLPFGLTIGTIGLLLALAPVRFGFILRGFRSVGDPALRYLAVWWRVVALALALLVLSVGLPTLATYVGYRAYEWLNERRERLFPTPLAEECKPLKATLTIEGLEIDVLLYKRGLELPLVLTSSESCVRLDSASDSAGVKLDRLIASYPVQLMAENLTPIEALILKVGDTRWVRLSVSVPDEVNVQLYGQAGKTLHFQLYMTDREGACNSIGPPASFLNLTVALGVDEAAPPKVRPEELLRATIDRKP
jgi:hypothetical protein